VDATIEKGIEVVTAYVAEFLNRPPLQAQAPAAAAA
jgi:hypothetical protein